MVVMCSPSSGVNFIPRRSPPPPPPPRRWTVCSASNINNTEQLRAQLDELHSEAKKTNAKANSARLRLMRLSEAAENLRRQAAVSVQTGRENDAWELLVQKKKVIQALEKSKSRIELLDELSAKLNEAIVLKENQLIGNVALDLGVDREDASSPVRIVLPKEETPRNSKEPSNLNLNVPQLCADEEFEVDGGVQTELPIAGESSEAEDSWVRGIGSLEGISSYQDFIAHLDKQFSKIEAELLTVVRLSTLVLENEEKPQNSKVQQAMEILEAVRQLRRSVEILRSLCWAELQALWRTKKRSYNFSYGCLKVEGIETSEKVRCKFVSSKEHILKMV